MSASFEVLAACPHTVARRSRLTVSRGTIELPAFMPVATVGAVKTLDLRDVEQLGFDLILANSYHLELRPGSDLIERIGGLRRFMGWSGAILTDSGGYQAYSLAKMREIDDDGVRFRSHLDGSEVQLTPESVMQIQSRLGVDVSMVLDHCPPYPCSRADAAEAVRRTTHWAERSIAARADGQRAFGIVQGGVYADLRAESARAVCELPFEGFAIGGVSVGEPSEAMRSVVRQVAPLLPEGRPRYLMGVGHPNDILDAIEQGMDLFDCVLPTRMGRHGALYTLSGRVNAKRLEYAERSDWYDPDSMFAPLEGCTPAYLRHLLKSGEPTGARLASLHNLAFYARLMAEARMAIERGDWPRLRERYARA